MSGRPPVVALPVRRKGAVHNFGSPEERDAWVTEDPSRRETALAKFVRLSNRLNLLYMVEPYNNRTLQWIKDRELDRRTLARLRGFVR